MFDITTALFDQINALVTNLQYHLSLDHIAYDITIDGKTFHFKKATTKEEEEEQSRLRTECIQLLLYDALKYCVLYALGQKKAPSAFDVIHVFDAVHVSVEDVASPIPKEFYDEAKAISSGGTSGETDMKSKSLDLDSLYVNAERPDWDEAKQEYFVMTKKGREFSE